LCLRTRRQEFQPAGKLLLVPQIYHSAKKASLHLAIGELECIVDKVLSLFSRLDLLGHRRKCRGINLDLAVHAANYSEVFVPARVVQVGCGEHPVAPLRRIQVELSLDLCLLSIPVQPRELPTVSLKRQESLAVRTDGRTAKDRRAVVGDGESIPLEVINRG